MVIQVQEVMKNAIVSPGAFVADANACHWRLKMFAADRGTV